MSVSCSQRGIPNRVSKRLDVKLIDGDVPFVSIPNEFVIMAIASFRYGIESSSQKRSIYLFEACLVAGVAKDLPACSEISRFSVQFLPPALEAFTCAGPHRHQSSVWSCSSVSRVSTTLRVFVS